MQDNFTVVGTCLIAVYASCIQLSSAANHNVNRMQREAPAGDRFDTRVIKVQTTPHIDQLVHNRGLTLQIIQDGCILANVYSGASR